MKLAQDITKTRSLNKILEDRDSDRGYLHTHDIICFKPTRNAKVNGLRTPDKERYIRPVWISEPKKSSMRTLYCEAY